jgi:hypothetical protein
LLACLALNGWAAAALLETAGAGRAPAWLGGLFASALPFVLHEIGVLQLAALFPVFLALKALAALGKHARLRPALSLGVWAAASALTCGYYALFLSVFLLLGGVVIIRRAWLGARPVAQLLAGSALAALLALPVLVPQARLAADYLRTKETITRTSAEAADYLRLGAWQPYDLLRAHYPGFAQLRSPFRLSVFVEVFLVGLAGMGLQAIWGWPGRPARSGRGLRGARPPRGDPRASRPGGAPAGPFAIGLFRWGGGDLSGARRAEFVAGSSASEAADDVARYDVYRARSGLIKAVVRI